MQLTFTVEIKFLKKLNLTYFSVQWLRMRRYFLMTPPEVSRTKLEDFKQVTNAS